MRETYLPNRLEWREQPYGYQIIRNGACTSLHGLSTEQVQGQLHKFLDSVDSFSFSSRMGYTGTFRKEKVQRGGEYWRVYKKIDGKLCKKYVGKPDGITLETIEAVTQQVVGGSVNEMHRAKERRDARQGKHDFKRRFSQDAGQTEQQPQAESASQTERPRKRRLEDVLREQREKTAREQQEREAAERERAAQAEREQQEQARKRAEAAAAHAQKARDEARKRRAEQAARAEQARKRAEEAQRERQERDAFYGAAQRNAREREEARRRQQQHTYGSFDFGAFSARLDALRTMGFDAMPSASDLKRRHRELAMKYHPDRGGDTAMMAKVNAANDLLKKCVAA